VDIGEDGLRVAQKLFAAVPEFHGSGVVNAKSSSRPEVTIPPSSDRGYKAIVFVMLDGGSDSYNMLVPHSGCTGKGENTVLFCSLSRYHRL